MEPQVKPSASDQVTDLADPVMFTDPFPRYAVLPAAWSSVAGVFEAADGRPGLHADPTRGRAVVAQRPALLERPDDGRIGFHDAAPAQDVPPLTNSMVYKDYPDHARLRRLVNKAFTPRMVQQMTGDIERIVDGLVDDLDRRVARRSTWWRISPRRFPCR